MSKQQNIKDPADKPVPDQDSTTVDVEVQPAENAGEPATLLASGDDPVQLRVELDLAQAALEDHKEKYLRAMAELDNVRRRAANDVVGARKFAVDGFAREALQVRDSLELARAVELSEEDKGVVEKMKEGLDLTLKQLDAVFDKFGIKVVEPAPGDKLDPELHQAMTIQESDEIQPNHIITVIQKGYAIHDRLLRPAMVIVAKAGTRAESTPENP